MFLKDKIIFDELAHTKDSFNENHPENSSQILSSTVGSPKNLN